MSKEHALLLRIHIAIEGAEQRLIPESVVANARTAVGELIDRYRMVPAMAKFIEDRWQLIEAFLNSRNCNLTVVSICGVEERTLSEAWSALEELRSGLPSADFRPEASLYLGMASPVSTNEYAF